MAKKIKEFKRCPRCDTKTVIYQDVCPACGLIYSRLSKASNKEAKKALRKGEKHKVICDKVLPKDVNKWKLFFMALFLGMFGGHYYYVGKNKTGTVFIVSTALLFIGTAIAQNDASVWVDYYFWMYMLILPASACLIALAVDLVRILTNGFRVPIAIKEDVVVEGATTENTKEVLEIVEQVTKEVNKENKKKEKQQESVKKTEGKAEEQVEETKKETAEPVKEEPAKPQKNKKKDNK